MKWRDFCSEAFLQGPGFLPRRTGLASPKDRASSLNDRARFSEGPGALLRRTGQPSWKGGSAFPEGPGGTEAVGGTSAIQAWLRAFASPKDRAFFPEGPGFDQHARPRFYPAPSPKDRAFASPKDRAFFPKGPGFDRPTGV